MSKRFVVASALVFLVCSIVLPTTASAATTGVETDQTFLSFTASNGLTSQYHLYAAGVAHKPPSCAVFQFHGDGAYEFNNPTASYSLGGPNGIVAKLREQGCLTVPVLSPDKTGSITWWENGAENAQYAHELMSKITADYKLDTARIWLVGYSGGSQFITQFYLPLYSSTIKGGAAVLFGGGGSPYSVTEKPYASTLTSAFHLHWYTGAIDDGRGGSYNALRDAQAGEEHYKALGFSTSDEYPAATGHALDGRFGGIVAHQLRLYNHAAATPTPSTDPPQSPAISWTHTVVSTRTGATLTANVPSQTTRTTFRVSRNQFGAQTGFYVYTTRTGDGITLTLSNSLTPGLTYNYQVESGTDRQVVGRGTLTTAP
ncbi:MAG: hypothetical protein ACR2LI_08605 [Propionibacteriaceae bacterium]